jgi:hypothetical protein
MPGRNLGISGSSRAAMIDAAGNSRLGIWPLDVGQQHFALIAGGSPRFNRPAFVDRAGFLARRDAGMAGGSGPGRLTRQRHGASRLAARRVVGRDAAHRGGSRGSSAS